MVSYFCRFVFLAIYFGFLTSFLVFLPVFSDFFGFLAIFLVLGILGFRVYRIFLGFTIFFRVSGILREGHFDDQNLVFAKI